MSYTSAGTFRSPLSGSNDPGRWSAVSGVERAKEAWHARLLESSMDGREIADDRPDDPRDIPKFPNPEGAVEDRWLPP